jgi:hypothetical protein
VFSCFDMAAVKDCQGTHSKAVNCMTCRYALCKCLSLFGSKTVIIPPEHQGVRKAINVANCFVWMWNVVYYFGGSELQVFGNTALRKVSLLAPKKGRLTEQLGTQWFIQVYCRVYKTQHFVSSWARWIHCNIILPPTPRSPKCPISLRFFNKNVVCLSHFILETVGEPSQIIIQLLKQDRKREREEG